MALAFLCSQLQRATLDMLSHDKSFHDDLKPFQGIKFSAFIADHGVRKGSADEAKAVASQLREYGTNLSGFLMSTDTDDLTFSQASKPKSFK